MLMRVSQDYTITQESFDSLTSYQHNLSYNIKWSVIFVLPGWLRVWWQAFGSGRELYLGAVRHRDRIIGIAPLAIKSETAAILGSEDVCDYLDFVVAEGKEREFFTVLLDDLRLRGVSYLDLRPLRADSPVLTSLVPLAREQGCEVNTQSVDVSLELELPATWDEYLEMLNRKQRHELRRKLRRLEEEGSVNYRMVQDKAQTPETMEAFLALFSRSRQDKAAFLTPRRASFLRSLTDTMAEAGLLRFGILEFNNQTAAMVLYFDYHNGIYLYNSGYDPQYRSLSVGLLSKALCIRDSISRGKSRFDFLKGGEAYKYHLGGKEVPLYRGQITLR